MVVAAQRFPLVGRPRRLVTLDGHCPGGAGLQAVAYRCGALGGQSAGGGAVGAQPVKVGVAGQAARRQHVRRRVRGEEARCRRVVDGAVACHVEQRGGGGPAGGHHEQVGVDPPGAAGFVHVDRLDGPRRARGGADPLPVAAVDDRSHVHTGACEVSRSGVAVGVGREDHRPFAWLDPPQIDQAPGGARGDRAGPVVAREHVGPFDQAGRGHEHLGPCLDEALDCGGVAALHDAEPVVLVAAGDGGVREHFDV